MSLIEDGALGLGTAARSVLGDDLPLIDDGVTVEHLLAHRSGIGDYLDEDAGHEITDHVMPVPVHELATTEHYLAVLDGHPTAFPPGERSAYCNGGYVVLALIAERTSGVPSMIGMRTRMRAGGDGPHRLLPLRRAPRRCGARLPHDRRPQDERPPPAGARQRGWRDLLDRGGPQRVLEHVFDGRIVPSDRVPEMDDGSCWLSNETPAE